MNNNPDVSCVVLHVFRNASDGDKSELRTYRVLNGEKMSGEGSKFNLSSSLSSPSCTLAGCVLVPEALLCWCCTNAQEIIIPAAGIYETLKRGHKGNV